MLPFTYAYGLGPEVLAPSSLVLAANGGTLALWVPLSDRIVVQGLTCRTLDTTGSHTLEVGLYRDDALVAMSATVSAWTFTATVAQDRTGALVAPVSLNAGMAWLLVRNSGATTTTLAAIAQGQFGNNNGAVTGTLPSSLTVTNMRAVAWSQAATVPLIRLNGSNLDVGSGQFA
jgi:hypothetical protein